MEDRVLKTILSADELMMAQRLVRQLPVGDQVVDAILKLVRSARPGTGIVPAAYFPGAQGPAYVEAA